MSVHLLFIKSDEGQPWINRQETTYLFMKKTSMKPLLMGVVTTPQRLMMHPCGWPQISRSAVRTAAGLP